MEVICSICCDVYEPNDSIVSVHCGHIFHEKCLTDWTKKSSICPNCQESCDSTKKIFLDFDKRDCNNCEQYSLMMEIKEAHIDKLNKNSKTIKDLKEENAKNQRKCDELSGKLTNTVKELKEKDNELATHHQIIEILKTEINALRITNNIENMAPKIEQTENSDVIPALAPIKSHLVQK